MEILSIDYELWKKKIRKQKIILPMSGFESKVSDLSTTP